MTPDFTFEFEELELAPGVLATGEADFVIARGIYIMTSLVIGWERGKRLCITSDYDPIWKLVETALLKDTSALSEAYDLELKREREYLRDAEAEYRYGN